jgi:hypothetical protein
VIDLLQATLAERDINVEVLATKLIINRCLVHGLHRRGTSVESSINMVCTPCG